MSATAIIRALLVAHAPLSALIAPGKIFVGDVPQETALPALSITEISRSELATVSRGQSTVLVTARVQVTVLAPTYPKQKELLAAAKLSAGTHTGTIAGFPVRAVTREGVGPDLRNYEPNIFEQSRDFKVAYIEPN